LDIWIVSFLGLNYYITANQTLFDLYLLAFMQVSIVNKSHHALPHYQTIDSAGMDLHAFLPQGVIVLQPLERLLIPTGIFIALPTGYEAQVRPRSGLAYKQGITCLNTPGTIDADYRGEVKVLLINLSNQAQEIKDGDRIAQMVVTNYTRVTWQATDSLDGTERGEGGFGHTGK
jgi:dUTP pyrophosphatase